MKPLRDHGIHLSVKAAKLMIRIYAAMITPPQHATRRNRGFTMIEITLVVGLMMSMIGMLFIGARAWRVGSDRSKCILNQRQMQMSVRSYQNMYGFANGATPPGDNIPEILRNMEFIGENLYRRSIGEKNCPGTGVYSIADPSRFPDEKVLFMSCSLAELRRHLPDVTENW